MSTPSKSIDDLRNALFDAIDGVKSGALDVEKARAINEIAKTLTDTAKVEVEYLKANDGGESTFIAGAIGKANLPAGLPAPAEPGNGVMGIRRHLIGD